MKQWPGPPVEGLRVQGLIKWLQSISSKWLLMLDTMGFGFPI